MKKTCVLLALILGTCFVVPTFIARFAAQEAVTLATPITKPSIASCALDYLVIDPDLTTVANGRIMAVLQCGTDTVQKVYDASSTPTGASLLTSLNTSNNSGANTSLIKKVYTRLIADGVITGTVAGTPQ